MSTNNTTNDRNISEDNDANKDIVGISKGAAAVIGGISALIGAVAGVLTVYGTFRDEWKTWRVIKSEHLEDATKENPVPNYNHDDEVARILTQVDSRIDTARRETLEVVDGRLASLRLSISNWTGKEMAKARTEILATADEKIATATAATFETVNQTISRAIEPLAYKAEVPELIDLSPFALSDNLPDFAQFVRINQLPPSPDLSPYALKTEVVSFGSQVRLVSIESGMSFWCGATNKPETSCLSRPLAAATPWRLDRPN